MLFVKILSAAALVGSIAWCVAAPDYEPAIAIITSLSTLVTTLFIERKRTQQATQKQVISTNGFGIQAGGNVTTGDIKIAKGHNNAQ